MSNKSKKVEHLNVGFSEMRNKFHEMQKTISDTPFLDAVKKCYYQERVVPCVEAGQSLNIQDEEGNTPLMLAMQGYANVGIYLGNGDMKSLWLAMVKYFSSKAMDVNIKNNDGKNAICLAIEHNIPKEIVYTLLNKGFIFNGYAVNDCEELKTAIEKGESDMIDMVKTYIENKLLSNCIYLSSNNEENGGFNF